MIVPSANILNIALGALGRQGFNYKAFVSRDLSAVGVYVANYAFPIQLTGSVQPPARELFHEYGLDFQKDYLMFYVSKHMLDVTRDVSGDQIEFNNKTYQILSKTNWLAIDGWISLLTVQIPEDPC